MASMPRAGSQASARVEVLPRQPPRAAIVECRLPPRSAKVDVRYPVKCIAHALSDIPGRFHVFVSNYRGSAGPIYVWYGDYREVLDPGYGTGCSLRGARHCTRLRLPVTHLSFPVPGTYRGCFACGHSL